MKKFTFSVVAIMAISTFTMAGGDMPPVPVADDSGFYVGSGYSYIDFNAKYMNNELDITANAYTVLAGYQFNKYMAIEGRYAQTIDDFDTELNGSPAVGMYDGADMSNIALYLKAMYPVGGVTLYGLLGYGQFTFDNDREYTESSFQWGVGASYGVMESISLFVEYTRFYDDKDFDQGAENPDTDVIVDAINFGITYQF